jgi:transcriptional regulator GlxA family with amidase domain
MKLEDSEIKTIAFVIYPGLTLFDLVGPLGVLQKFCELMPGYRTTVVSETMQPIESDNGLTVIPDSIFAEVPHPYAVFVPGGSAPTLKAMSHPPMRAYLKKASESATLIGSVCTGALILAALGLLTGKNATTHWAYKGILESFGSSYQRQRWVMNGKIINSAGVSAGVDMGLYFISQLSDEDTARRVQLHLDYDPRPPFRIDWQHLPLMARVMRAYHGLAAPWITSGAKKLLKAGR